MEVDPLLSEHKLCGFLRAVLSATSASVKPGTPCSLFGEGSSTGFLTEDGIILLPIPEPNACSPDEFERSEDPVTSTPPLSSRKRKRKRRKGIGTVNGSMSVVHLLHALVAHMCLRIRATVVEVSVRGSGNVRAVVLVDVYLPLGVWSGWQFPKSGALAASLFRHVSVLFYLCDRCGENQEGELVPHFGYSPSLHLD